MPLYRHSVPQSCCPSFHQCIQSPHQFDRETKVIGILLLKGIPHLSRQFPESFGKYTGFTQQPSEPLFPGFLSSLNEGIPPLIRNLFQLLEQFLETRPRLMSQRSFMLSTRVWRL